MKRLLLTLFVAMTLASVAYPQVLSCNGTTLLTVAKNQTSGDNLLCPRCGGYITLTGGALDLNQPYTLTIDGATLFNDDRQAIDSTHIRFYVPGGISAPSLPYNTRSVYVHVLQGSTDFCGVMRLTKSNAYFKGDSNAYLQGAWQLDGGITNLITDGTIGVSQSVGTSVLLRAFNVGNIGPTITVKIGATNYTAYAYNVTSIYSYGAYDLIIYIPAGTQATGSFFVNTYYGGRYSDGMLPLSVVAN